MGGDLGKNLDGGVFCNFGFGLREKVGNLDSVTSDLDLGKKLENWMGGYSVTSDLDLGKKLEIWIGGVFCNFGFGLREKVGNLDFGGVFCNFGFGLREKVGNLDLDWGGIL